MPYFLLAAGLLLIVYGGFLLKKENQIHGEGFHDLLAEQSRDREEYIKLLAGNQDLKLRLNSVEAKLDHVSDQLERMDQYQSRDFDAGLAFDNIDTGSSFNMEKGEVRFIQNLLEK